MRKNTSMPGTLNRLFGKKQQDTSLFAANPPWILPQPPKRGGPKDDPDSVLASYSFADDESGTATLRNRPRVRPFLPFSSGNIHEVHGLAIPTPSVPKSFADSVSLGNGPKINGNYRMYSSAGDLRQASYGGDYLEDEIPPPPSVPPPPPPPMMPPPPPPLPQEMLLSSTASSPVSPAPPDFIPPEPPLGAPPTLIAAPISAPFQSVSKWKSETILTALQSGDQASVPYRNSWNVGGPNPPALPQKPEPHLTFPRSFKVPPPAPVRSSSIPYQEHKTQQANDFPYDSNFSQTSSRPPIPSSFNPKAEAKIFSPALPNLKPTNDTINKRKSVIIMEDPTSPSQSLDSNKISESLNSSRAALLGPTSPKPVKAMPQLPVSPATEVRQWNSTKSNFPVRQGERVNPSADSVSLNDGQKPVNNIHQLKEELNAMVAGRVQKDEEPLSPSDNTDVNKLTGNITSDFVNDDASQLLKPARKNIPLLPVKPITTQKDDHLEDGWSPMNDEASEPLGPNASSSDITEKQPNQIKEIQNQLSAFISGRGEKQAEEPLNPKVDVDQNKHSRNSSVDRINPEGSKQSKTGIKIIPLLPTAGKLKKDEEDAKSGVPLTPEKVSMTINPNPPNKLPDNTQKKQNKISKLKNDLETLLSPTKKDKPSLGPASSKHILDVKKDTENLKSKQVNAGEPELLKVVMKKIPLIPPSGENTMKEIDSAESDAFFNNKPSLNIVIPDPDYLPLDDNQEHTHSKPDLIPKTENTLPTLKGASPPQNKDQELQKNSVPQYKIHHDRKPSASSMSSLASSTSELEQQINTTKNSINIPSSSDSTPQPSPSLSAPTSRRESRKLTHPVTGEEVEAGTPLALLLAAKNRAQKGKRSFSQERPSMPENFGSSGSKMSSAVLQYSSSNPNSFVVVPKSQARDPPVVLKDKEECWMPTYNERPVNNTMEQANTDSKVGSTPDKSFNKANWKDEEPQKSKFDTSRVDQGLTQTTNENYSNPARSYLTNSSDIHISSFSTPLPFTVMGEEKWTNGQPQKTTSTGLAPALHLSTNLIQTYPKDTSDFQISSFASPIPYSIGKQEQEEELNYGLIPPPPEFSNDIDYGTQSYLRSKVEQRDSSYQNRFPSHQSTDVKPDLRPMYDHNYMVSQTLAPNDSYKHYPSNSYSTNTSGIRNGYPLIKKRLYLPEPERPKTYGKMPMATRTLPSPTSYHPNLVQYSSSPMITDSRRTSLTSRSSIPGRKLSLESPGRLAPPSAVMSEMKHKMQNPEISYNRGMSRTQHNAAYQHGTTFVVRPGTRQPISYLQQNNPY